MHYLHLRTNRLAWPNFWYHTCHDMTILEKTTPFTSQNSRCTTDMNQERVVNTRAENSKKDQSNAL